MVNADACLICTQSEKAGLIFGFQRLEGDEHTFCSIKEMAEGYFDRDARESRLRFASSGI